MNKEEFFRAIGEVDDAQVLEAEGPAGKRRSLLPRLAPLAACLLLLIGAAAVRSRLSLPVRPSVLPESRGQTGDSFDSAGQEERPSLSCGVTITPFDPAERRRDAEAQKGASEDTVSSGSSMDLVWLTPEELLERDTWIFRGTVEDMSYYKVDEIGALGGCFTVAEVRVTDVLRGELTAGDTCRVLLPVVRGYMSNSIAGVLEEVEVGSEAIFMPRPASPETVVSESGRSFCYADVADAYFTEGLRFLFLQTGDGLRFERSAYADIRDAQTLDEVYEYLRGMLP